MHPLREIALGQCPLNPLVREDDRLERCRRIMRARMESCASSIFQLAFHVDCISLIAVDSVSLSRIRLTEAEHRQYGKNRARAQSVEVEVKRVTNGETFARCSLQKYFSGSIPARGRVVRRKNGSKRGCQRKGEGRRGTRGSDLALGLWKNFNNHSFISIALTLTISRYCPVFGCCRRGHK